jgi:hypothetical protein
MLGHLTFEHQKNIVLRFGKTPRVVMVQASVNWLNHYCVDQQKVPV